MIIWSGWGILVPLVMALALLLAVPFQGDTAKFGLAASQIAAAVAIWYLGRYFNSKPGRVVVDPATGETINLRRKHSLFFIKMEYWAVPVGLLAIAFLTA